MLLDFLFISFVLFLLGVLGIILNRKNIILILIAIELILLAVNLNFIVFSVFLDDLLGQVFSLLILTIAAAESAVGLAIVVIYYRVRGSILIENLAVMRG
jgi:NADH-quinone oxidoreductase subunit K|tara:strand:- start:152 stop:451 length:300 start_codon:yes stop_codon:yes gene_type:complete